MEKVFDILYNHFEFFLSKEDIKILFPLKSLTYTEYLNSVSYMYEEKDDTKKFQYNIRFTPSYIDITKLLTDIKNILKNDVIPDVEKTKIIENIKRIKYLLKMSDLNFYSEEFVYAHYKMEEFRNNSKLFKQRQYGGGLTLEQFKQKIREKIMDL
jgi:hypothetical protein